MIDDLNKLASSIKIDLAKERKSTDPYHAFFSLNKDANGLIKFEQLPGFEMQLDVEMVKFLNLPLDASWLIQTVIGSKAVVMTVV